MALKGFIIAGRKHAIALFFFLSHMLCTKETLNKSLAAYLFASHLLYLKGYM